MKGVWYFLVVMLMLGVLAGFSSMSSSTGAFTANLPPQWDYPTSEFYSSEGQLSIDLNRAFFDPDADPLSFSVSPGAGVSAGVYGDTLIAVGRGSVIITASDGKNLVSKNIELI